MSLNMSRSPLPWAGYFLSIICSTPGVESIRALHGGNDVVLQAAGSLDRYWLVLARPGH